MILERNGLGLDYTEVFAIEELEHAVFSSFFKIPLFQIEKPSWVFPVKELYAVIVNLVSHLFWEIHADFIPYHWALVSQPPYEITDLSSKHIGRNAKNKKHKNNEV